LSCFIINFEALETINTIHWFDKKNVVELPETFTYPFNYEPHPLALMAAEKLQDYLLKNDWDHNFGFDKDQDGKATGKMFGVLIIEKDGRIGYLWGFSGRLAGKSEHDDFVPPVFNILDEDGFYRKGEKHLNILNQEVNELQVSYEYLTAKNIVKQAKRNFESDLANLKSTHTNRKSHRQQLRKNAADEVKSELAKQSMQDHFELKELKRRWLGEIEKLEEILAGFEVKITEAKAARKKFSNNLQQQIFEAFSFKNALGETKDLNDIFGKLDTPTPSGAGECSAPKLLQHAFNHDLKPIAMAEFWWGSPPQNIIRKHGHFYPACKSKCKPILGHMLKGLSVAPNPLEEDHKEYFLEVIYEDEDILAVNKPEGLLSVPGKTKRASVLSIIQSQVQGLEGPIIVHRLDMSTSGIMLLAKNTAAYHDLQQQFANKTIRKKYLAILDGVLKMTSGTISLPLRVDLDNRPQQMVCFEHGKNATTEYTFLERKGKRSKVAFHPITGRTHQLRVHSAHPKGLNMSIVGDDLYGTVDKRLMLHAQEITFIHPSEKQEITLSTPDPF
jgi:tRNA pseudouridine32 synthase/23S rRNA pseudouridine746 synthase